jgi:WhiB family transcriptional regulator, redox-sensing transcriptional regulator
MVVTELLSERAEREARRDWWQAAACRTADPDIFFPVSAHGPGEVEIARAKAVCAKCPVRRQCLQFALATHQMHGVWGGTTEEERRLHLHTRPVVPAQPEGSRGALAIAMRTSGATGGRLRVRPDSRT